MSMNCFSGASKTKQDSYSHPIDRSQNSSPLPNVDNIALISSIILCLSIVFYLLLEQTHATRCSQDDDIAQLEVRRPCLEYGFSVNQLCGKCEK